MPSRHGIPRRHWQYPAIRHCRASWRRDGPSGPLPAGRTTNRQHREVRARSRSAPPPATVQPPSLFKSAIATTASSPTVSLHSAAYRHDDARPAEGDGGVRAKKLSSAILYSSGLSNEAATPISTWSAAGRRTGTRTASNGSPLRSFV